MNGSFNIFLINLKEIVTKIHNTISSHSTVSSLSSSDNLIHRKTVFIDELDRKRWFGSARQGIQSLQRVLGLSRVSSQWDVHEKPPNWGFLETSWSSEPLQLYSELLTLFKADPSLSFKESSFHPLASKIWFFCPDPNLMSTSKSWNVDRPVNREFCLSTPLFPHHNHPKQRPHYWGQGHLRQHLSFLLSALLLAESWSCLNNRICWCFLDFSFNFHDHI